MYSRFVLLRDDAAVWLASGVDASSVAVWTLAVCGFAVLVVWPTHGPSAWLRERVRPALRLLNAEKVIDCYICCSPWVGMLAVLIGAPWPVLLIPAAVFWWSMPANNRFTMMPKANPDGEGDRGCGCGAKKSE